MEGGGEGECIPQEPRQRFLGSSRDIYTDPRKFFKILNPEIAGNALKLSILPSPDNFVSF